MARHAKYDLFNRPRLAMVYFKCIYHSYAWMLLATYTPFCFFNYILITVRLGVYIRSYKQYGPVVYAF